MKVYFIINPKAGKGKGINELKGRIKNSAEYAGVDYSIYMTQAAHDAEKYVRDICEKNKYETLRFIACGGDGTLNEILNGVMGYDNAEVGVVPVGTGNDFCRNFDDETDFYDISAQLSGEADFCDVLKYRGIVDGEYKERYCANMFNIGFDCNVADMTAKLKKYPFIGGSVAYLLAIFIILVKKKGADLKIEIDGETCHNGKLLLMSAANGSYCGGGIKSAPRASVRDGIMDINIIYNISRIEFLKKLPYYADGTYTSIPDIEKIISTRKCKTAKVIPNMGTMRLCVDGEISDADTVEFEVIKNAFKFVVPRLKSKVNILK